MSQIYFQKAEKQLRAPQETSSNKGLIKKSSPLNFRFPLVVFCSPLYAPQLRSLAASQLL